MHLTQLAEEAASDGWEQKDERVPLYIQLSNMYAPAWGYGGPVRLMFGYARWMDGQFKVAAFTGDVDHDFNRIPQKFEVIQGVPIYRSHVFFPSLLKASIYLLSPAMWVQAAKQIRLWDGPAIVHFSEFRGLIPLYALLLKLVFGNRVTLIHSAFGSLHYKKSIRRKIYDVLIMPAFIKLVDIRLVQNEHEREAYQEICGRYAPGKKSRIVLQPLHVDEMTSTDMRFTESGKNSAAVGEARRKYGVPEAALVFLFLGRLHPAKGIIRMIDAFLEFSGSCSQETLLLIVGRDDGFQSKVDAYIAQKGVQDKIRIVNNVYEGRFDYYFLADIFLGFPTIFEETMLASIEAMSCGTPIVVSQEADIPFVAEEQAGYVIDFGVPEAVQAISDVVQHLDTFQKNARRSSLLFDGARLAPKVLELFRSSVTDGLASLDQRAPGDASYVEPRCAPHR